MKKNLPLIAGIAIPVALILFVAGSIYIPGLFSKPKYNFLYATGNFYDNPYQVVEGHLKISTSTASTTIDGMPKPVYPPMDQQTFYVYDIAANKSTQISPADAEQLSLDTSTQSPDGYSVVAGTNNGWILPFFSGGNDYSVRYIEGHNTSRKLNIPTLNDYPYSYNFTFIGWIEQ